MALHTPAAQDSDQSRLGSAFESGPESMDQRIRSYEGSQKISAFPSLVHWERNSNDWGDLDGAAISQTAPTGFALRCPFRNV